MPYIYFKIKSMSRNPALQKFLATRKGFTVVESLVVIAIISVFVAVVISNFYQIKLQFALSRVAYKFDQDLRKAQNLSSSAAPYVDSSGIPQIVNGYGVYVDINSLGNKKYIIYADRPDSATTLNGITYLLSNKYYDSLDYVVETIDVSSAETGVVIKEINTPDVSNNISIDFNSSDLATIITIPPPIQQNKNNVDIVFALESDLTNTRTISVNTSGLIETK